MAANMFFSRDSKVFIVVGNDRYEIPVLDGFSFSQATNASEITLNEMSAADGTSRRGRQMFTDSFAPAEWSFSTYARPFIAKASDDHTQNEHHAVEEILWALMVGSAGSASVDGAISTLGTVTNGGSGVLTGATVAGPVTVATTTDGDGDGASLQLTRTAANGITAAVVSSDRGKNYEAGDKLFVANDVIKSAFGKPTAVTNNLQVAVSTVSSLNTAIEGLESDADDLDITFEGSNKSTLGTADIYFQLGGASGNDKVYKISKCCLNEASFDFDIEGIATISWSGMGSIISEVASVPSPAGTAYTDGTDRTDNFIRNRLTSLAISDSASTYNVVLTGGNVTITNNLTFITPETLGVVNQPLGHVTGARSIAGSFTCYLNADGVSSAKLFKNLIEDTDTITNSFNLEFSIGGSDSTPRVVLDMDQCHLEVPSHSIEDVISVETNFHALPSTIDGTNELRIKYVGPPNS